MARSLRKPTKTMRADAWRALHSLAVDPESGDSARVSAARALIAGDPELAKKEAAEKEASRWPKPCLMLPDNSRDGADACGLTETDYAFTIIFDESTPEGIADYARWRAEVAAKNLANSPKPPPLLLAAPKPRKRLTGAERSRAWRARQKAARAA